MATEKEPTALELIGRLISMALIEAGGMESGMGAAFDGKRMLTIKEAAKYIGCGVTHFRERVKIGELPQSIETVGLPRWDRKQLDNYLRRQGGKASKNPKK